jgi:hypothetical protein
MLLSLLYAAATIHLVLLKPNFSLLAGHLNAPLICAARLQTLEFRHHAFKLSLTAHQYTDFRRSGLPVIQALYCVQKIQTSRCIYTFI